MLDLDHPQTKHVFKADALEDALLASAQQMPLLPPSEREALLAKARLDLDALHNLNRDAFDDAPFLTVAIAEAQAALEHLAHSGDERDLEAFFQARAKTESARGFGTCFI